MSVFILLPLLRAHVHIRPAPLAGGVCVYPWNHRDPFGLDFELFHFMSARGLEPICLPSPTKLWHFGG